MVRLIKMFSVMVMVLVLSSVVYGQSFGKETLKGLKGVYVLVYGLKPDIEKDGLRKDAIQTDVELKLRMSGIKVLTEEECLKEPGNPALLVAIHSIKNKILGFYAYNVAVELRQTVFLLRDIKIICPAKTWGTGTIGVVGEYKVNALRDDVKGFVDKFINDYLEMNPKE